MAGGGVPASGRTNGSSFNFNHVGSDGRSGGGNHGFHSSARRFNWVSSSPAPAVVAALEKRFPDVLQVPAEALAAESEEWGIKAVFARSLSRWVPPEAIVRELRRAGAAGEIEALSLAHRHFLFRFSDPDAKNLALGRPWVVNGQPIAMEDWRPEFVPSEESLSSVLLWIRLPALPIEFWPEPIVSSILSVAGDFVCLDAATRERKRGGFARGCVRVDLRKPLRPGVRVRGCSTPFWQPFVFEHVEGICSNCGSLHQGEGCGSAAEGSSSSPLFGPWMAALRRPSIPASNDLEAGSRSKKAPTVSSEDGWQLPKKVARRFSARVGEMGVASGCPAVTKGENVRPPVSSEVGKEADDNCSSAAGSGIHSQLKDSVDGGNACRTLYTVPVLAGSFGMTGTPVPPLLKAASDNPFSLLGSDKWAGRPKIQPEANPGPLKRARAVEAAAPKDHSKASKGKGKLDGRGKGKAQSTFVFTSGSGDLRGIGTLSDMVPELTQPEVGLAQAVTNAAPQLSAPVTRTHDAVVNLLKKAIQVESAVESMDCQDRGASLGDPNDCGTSAAVMLGDRGTPPDTQ